MQMLTRRKRNMEIAQIIDDASMSIILKREQDVPKWKQKQPQWWIEYLISLGMDPTNP